MNRGLRFVLAALLSAAALPARAEEVPEEQQAAIRKAWSTLGCAAEMKHRDWIWNAFTAEAQAWVLGDGRAELEKTLRLPEEEFAELARQMGLSAAEARKLDGPSCARRLAATIVLEHAPDEREWTVDAWTVVPQGVRLKLSQRSARTLLTFSLQDGVWKLPQSHVAGLCRWWECRRRTNRLTSGLWKFESRFDRMPEDLSLLQGTEFLADASNLECGESQGRFEYLFPFQRYEAPEDRILLYDSKPHADGTRLVVSVWTHASWVEEEDFRAWLKRDAQSALEAIEKAIEEAKAPESETRLAALKKLKAFYESVR